MRVLRFAQRLRKDGIDAQIDQYVSGTTGRRAPLDVGFRRSLP
jgi:hypothetical protein